MGEREHISWPFPFCILNDFNFDLVIREKSHQFALVLGSILFLFFFPFRSMRNICIHSIVQRRKRRTENIFHQVNIISAWLERNENNKRWECAWHQNALEHSVKFGCKIHLFFEHWHPIHSLHKITLNEIYSFWFQMLFFSPVVPVHMYFEWMEQTNKKWFGFDKCTTFIHGIDDLMKRRKKTNWKKKINFSPTYKRRHMPSLKSDSIYFRHAKLQH